MNEIQMVKVIIVGDSYVGKTTFILRACLQKFVAIQSPTIGVDFQEKVMKKDGIPLNLQLWDVAGQEKFQNLSKIFIRGAKGCIVLSDINQKESLDHALQWRNIVADQEEVPIFLVQNKTDLLTCELQPFQTLSFLEDFAQRHHFTKCYQTSVKCDDNLDTILYDLIDAMIAKGTLRIKESLVKTFSSFHLDATSSLARSPNKKSQQCC